MRRGLNMTFGPIWLVLALAITPAGARAAEATAPIGDLIIRYDQELWEISGSGARYEFRCRGEDCEEPIAEIVVGEDKGRTCDLDAHVDESGFKPVYFEESSGGIELEILAPDLGCRNLAGGPVFACARHGGKVYLFTGAEHASCRYSSRAMTDALIALVRGLSAK